VMHINVTYLDVKIRRGLFGVYTLINKRIHFDFKMLGYYMMMDRHPEWQHDILKYEKSRREEGYAILAEMLYCCYLAYYISRELKTPLTETAFREALRTADNTEVARVLAVEHRSSSLGVEAKKKAAEKRRT
jgi:hypothetical protein